METIPMSPNSPFQACCLSPPQSVSQGARLSVLRQGLPGHTGSVRGPSGVSFSPTAGLHIFPGGLCCDSTFCSGFQEGRSGAPYRKRPRPSSGLSVGIASVQGETKS